MIDLYFEAAEEIGISSPPPLFFAKLKKGTLARANKTFVGSGFNERTLSYEILIDKEQMSSYEGPIPIKYIIAHEFAHIVTYSVLDGGGLTNDGEKHGASFLACWLHMLRCMKVSDDIIKKLAMWHAKEYQLSEEQLMTAIKSAYSNNKSVEAARAAVTMPPTPLWHNLLLLLFGGGFMGYVSWAICYL